MYYCKHTTTVKYLEVLFGNRINFIIIKSISFWKYGLTLLTNGTT